METQTTIQTSNLSRAVQEYLDRQSRVSHPAGRFDNGGRFWLADSERHSCCRSIRTPSRAWPYSEMVHGRTAAHVAHLYGVDVRELRRAIRAAQKAAKSERVVALAA